MNKRLIFLMVGILMAGAATTLWLSYYTDAAPDKKLLAAFTAKDFSDYYTTNGLTDETPPATLVPLKLSQSVRLAIGGLGLADNDQNQQLGDLVTAELTGAPGFNLVERQSLATILQELNLSMSGFVRAKDAVRVGKLLKADWFLLGTEAKINGTNSQASC